jgi:predicted nucleotidyltransferase
MTEQLTLKDVKSILQAQMPYLSERYQVESLGVFGSFVKNIQDEESDLDLLVTFHDVPGLLKFLELENYLSDQLGVKVDMVMRTALKPKIGQRILSEVVPV